MEPWHLDDQATIYHGDCIDVLRALPDASVDSVVTDPPYALNFMGKSWDDFRGVSVGACEECGDDDPSEGLTLCTPCAERLDEQALRSASMLGHQSQNWSEKATHSRGYADNNNAAFQRWCELWAVECLRVLKPGGHLLAFGGTRTWHRLAVAIEDAGFEIRDSIAWMYGSGFPKSLDVSKAIQKSQGVKPIGAKDNANGRFYGSGDYNPTPRQLFMPEPEGDAARWQGWGTALKPAHEPVVVARKPLTGTVAGNVLEHGTGALNIDGCRIGMTPEDRANIEGRTWVGRNRDLKAKVFGDYATDGSDQPMTVHPAGRWPANVVLDEDQAAALDKQSGNRPGGSYPAAHQIHSQPGQANGTMNGGWHGVSRTEAVKLTDSGGASRFFYVAKAPARERPKVDGVAHPTVKPLTLMRWLCRLVTPPGGVVLEPFAGSGTTIQAALLEGFRVVAIEREPDYLPLIAARLERVAQEPDDGQLTFDASA